MTKKNKKRELAEITKGPEEDNPIKPIFDIEKPVKRKPNSDKSKYQPQMV